MSRYCLAGGPGPAARGAVRSRTSASPSAISASRCRRTAGADSSSAAATAAAVTGPCSISSRATASRVRPSPVDGAASRRLDRGRLGVFHNTSVAYFAADRQSDPTGPGERPFDRPSAARYASRHGDARADWRRTRADDAADRAPPAAARSPSRALARRARVDRPLLMAVGALGAGAAAGAQPAVRAARARPAEPQRHRWPSPSPTPASACSCWPGCGSARCCAPTAPWPRHRTAASWPARPCCGPLPLAVAPPMFSRDVYSYLAQSAILARGLDPYVLGPAEALGVDDPLTRSIPTIWRDTPAPYGPLFLVLGRGITALTGNDVVLGVLAHRVLALAGLAMIVWALPRLARRCGLDAGLALWLGAANPLVLFHLVSGIHNEALMIGLMLVGHGGRRCAPGRGCSTTGCCSAPSLIVGRVRGEAAGAARARLPRARVARRRGGRRRATSPRWAACWPRSPCSATPRSSLGTGLGLRLDQHAGHPDADPQLDVGVHRPGPARRPDRHPRRARRPHRLGADADPRAVRAGRRGRSSRMLLLATLRGPARPGHRDGRRAGRRGAARAGRAPVVPAVGGDPAGRDPRPPALPPGGAGRLGRARRAGAAHRGRLQLPRLPAAHGDRRRRGDPGARAGRPAPPARRAERGRTSTRCPGRAPSPEPRGAS